MHLDQQANALVIETTRQIHVLDPGSYTVGRSRRADIYLQDARISRQHLQLEFDNGVLSAVDLGSKNGTYVNQERLFGSRCLHAGDQVQLGSHRLIAIQSNDAPRLPGQRLYQVVHDAGASTGPVEVTARVLDLLDVLTDDLGAGRGALETLDTIVTAVDDLLDRAGLTQPYLTEREALRLAHVVDIVTRRANSPRVKSWRAGVDARIAPAVEYGESEQIYV